MTDHHLAQVNIALPVEPLTSPRLAGFVNARRRREWFAPMREAYQALWWLPAGQLPTVADAERRVAHLRAHGPSEYAFTFRSPFPAPNGPVPATADDNWFCRA